MELLWFIATKYSELNPAIEIESCSIQDYSQKVREINNEIVRAMRIMDELNANFTDAKIINAIRKCVVKTLNAIRGRNIQSKDIHAEFMRTFRDNIYLGDDDDRVAMAFCDTLEHILRRSELMYITIQ